MSSYPYRPADKQLCDDRAVARKVVKKFNELE